MPPRKRLEFGTIDGEVSAISNSIKDRKVLCILKDRPWADMRVVKGTRAMILEAADHEICSFGGGSLGNYVIEVRDIKQPSEITEEAVWLVACELLKAKQALAWWPDTADGRLGFTAAANAAGLAAEAAFILR